MAESRRQQWLYWLMADEFDLSGTSVSTADFNGDGFDDLLIGALLLMLMARTLWRELCGVWQARGLCYHLDLAELDGSNGFTPPLDEGGGLGRSVSTARG